MQLKSLRLFTAAARTGSFLAAAEQQHTVQSNVTAHIKKLEAELGLRLFERPGRLRLTAAGRTLSGYAERILALHDEALARLRRGGEPGGTLYIGSLETTAAVRLPELLTGFHRRYPAVALSLQTGTTAELLRAVSEGTLDGAFVAGGAPGLFRMPVFDERLVLVTDRPFDAIPPREVLARTPMLAFRQGCGYRQRMDRFLDEQGVPPVRLFEFGTLDAILGCVMAGMGFTVLPAAVVQAQRGRFPLHTAALPEPLASVTTHFVTRAREGYSPTLTAFAEYVAAAG